MKCDESMAKQYSFRPWHRMRNRSEFLSMVGLPRRRGRFVIIQQRRNARAHSRLGIVAVRKLGCAVVRNRAKRLVREVFRHLQGNLKPPRDLVVRLLPSSRHATLDSLRGDLEALLLDSESSVGL